jgi:phospholipid transport system transporter-binding protein
MAERAAVAIDGDTLAVSGVLDADTVAALRDRGWSWLTDGAPPLARIDLGGVSYSSSAGVALLLAWQRAAGRAGKRIEIVNLPAQMAALIRVGGLDEVLDSVTATA